MQTRTQAPIIAHPVDSSYLQALRARGGPWRSVAAIAVGVAVFSFLIFVAATPVAIAVDILLGQAPYDPTAPSITIGLWAGGNLLIASMIPISGLIQWALFGVRPGRLSSVLGRFRWRWFAEVAMIFIPLWATVSVVIQGFVPSGAPVFSTEHLLLAAVALVTIPLQATGEEYLFRGLFFRAIGARFPRRGIAIAAAVVITSVSFAVFHAPGTGWALTYYVFMGVCFAVLTHMTGGLEASSLAHATGNTMLTLPILLSGNLDNLGGFSGPVFLVPMTAMALATAVIGWRARRRSLITRQRTTRVG